MHVCMIKGVLQRYNITFEVMIFKKNVSSLICTLYKREVSNSCNFSGAIVYE